MKVHEKDFNKTIIIVKNCWSNPNLNFWTTMAISRARSYDGSYNHVPPIPAESFVVEGSICLHLNVIKSTFCVVCKIIDGIMVSPLLDSHMLDVQSFCFRFIMSHNVEGAMIKHSKLNPVTKLWMGIILFPFWVKKLNEYNKLVDIAMVQVLGFVEDERTFNNLSFMKSKLWN